MIIVCLPVLIQVSECHVPTRRRHVRDEIDCRDAAVELVDSVDGNSLQGVSKAVPGEEVSHFPDLIGGWINEHRAGSEQAISFILQFD